MIPQYDLPPTQTSLSLFCPEPGSEGEDSGRPPLSADSSLSELFYQFFKPVILEAERDVKAGTIQKYVDAVGWWIALTRDPPLRLVDSYVLADFANRLKEATYRRGLLGKERKLSAYTRFDHLQHIQEILDRAGPNLDRRRKGLTLIPEAPHLSIAVPSTKVKPALSLVQAQRIAVACDAAKDPVFVGITAPDWWRAYIAVLFYTGIRAGTALRLRWSMFVEREDGWWLEVPNEAVTKTSKGLDRGLHPRVVQLLMKIRGHNDFIFPWVAAKPRGKRKTSDTTDRKHLWATYQKLCTAAGIDGKRCELQVWRRTHGTMMARLGLRDAMATARKALDHADERTTAGFYVDIEAELMRSLPDLWSEPALEPPAHGSEVRKDGQLLLF